MRSKSLKKRLFPALWCLLAVIGCQVNRPLHEATVLVLDNSASRLWQKEATQKQLLESAERWAEEAQNNDIFKVAVFSSTNPYQYVTPVTFQMELKPPVFEARLRAKKELTMQITQIIGKAEWTKSSPILEVLADFGKIYGRDDRLSWRVILFTDMLEDSKSLSLNSGYLAEHTDDEILSQMAEIAAAPDFPPQEVTIYYFPGVVNPDEVVENATYERVIALYQAFLNQWTRGKSTIDFVNLEKGD